MNRDRGFNYVELIVSSPEQLAATRAFYEAVFGWSYKEWTPNYVDTEDSGVVSGIHAEEGAPPMTLPAIYVDDLEAALEQVEAAGGVVTRAIWSYPGGRRFRMRGPSGIEVAVWTAEEIEGQ